MNVFIACGEVGLNYPQKNIFSISELGVYAWVSRCVSKQAFQATHFTPKINFLLNIQWKCVAGDLKHFISVCVAYLGTWYIDSTWSKEVYKGQYCTYTTKISPDKSITVDSTEYAACKLRLR